VCRGYKQVARQTDGLLSVNIQARPKSAKSSITGWLDQSSAMCFNLYTRALFGYIWNEKRMRESKRGDRQT
jgi:hypothetical protein